MFSRVSMAHSRPSDKPSPDSTSSIFSSASQYSTSLSSGGGEEITDDAPNKAQASRTHSATGDSENQPQPASLPSFSAFSALSAPHQKSTPPSTSTPRPLSRGRPTSSPSTLQPAPLQHSPPKGSYFSRQSTTPSTDARSPAVKRAPASRSSHGIETASGPPPALSTQRSYTAETTRSFYQPVELPKPKPTTHTAGGIDQAARPSPSSGMSDKDVMSNRRSSRMSLQDEDGDRTLTLRDGEGEQGGDETVSSQEDIFLNLAQQETAKSTLPELSGPRRRSIVDQPSRTQPQTTSTRPHSSGRLFPSEPSSVARHESPQWHSFRRDLRTDSALSSRDNSPRDRTYAASAHPLDGRIRQRYEPKTSFVSRTRRGSEQGEKPQLATNYENGRPARFQEPSNGLYNSSPLTRHSTINARHNRISNSFDAGETGSTASTTAPSTVWDELDDVKSRLKKIEAMGVIMPQSSQQAINNNSFAQQRRPATATTTITTISSSPKHKLANNSDQLHDPSPDSSILKGSVDPNIHPLLHTALAKANTVLPPEVYKSLEASATDALRLVILAREVKNPQPSDRQIRRKADSLCRSLTELCISLSEHDNNISCTRGFPLTASFSSSSRPGSSAGLGATATEGSTYHSANSSPTLKATPSSTTVEQDDNDLARASSRVMSRIEARRSSLQLMNGNHLNGGSGSGTPIFRKGSSPLESLTPTQATPSVTSSSARPRDYTQRDPSQAPPSRATSLLLRHRTRHIGNGDPDNSSDNGSAFSTAGLTRNKTSRLTRDRDRDRDRNRERKRESREYTSSHPLPGLPTGSSPAYEQQQQKSPELSRPPLPKRDSYFQAQPRDTPHGEQGPITPPVSSGMIAGHVRRNYLERNTPPREQLQEQQQGRQSQSNTSTLSVFSNAGLAGRRERLSTGGQGRYPSSGSRLLLGATRRRSQRGEE